MAFLGFKVFEEVDRTIDVTGLIIVEEEVSFTSGAGFGIIGRTSGTVFDFALSTLKVRFSVSLGAGSSDTGVVFQEEGVLTFITSLAVISRSAVDHGVLLTDSVVSEGSFRTFSHTVALEEDEVVRTSQAGSSISGAGFARGFAGFACVATEDEAFRTHGVSRDAGLAVQ